MLKQIDKREAAILLAAGVAVGIALVLAEAPVWAVYAAVAVCGVVYVVLSMGRARGDYQPHAEAPTPNSPRPERASEGLARAGNPR